MVKSHSCRAPETSHSRVFLSQMAPPLAARMLAWPRAPQGHADLLTWKTRAKGWTSPQLSDDPPAIVAMAGALASGWSRRPGMRAGEWTRPGRGTGQAGSTLSARPSTAPIGRHPPSSLTDAAHIPALSTSYSPEPPPPDTLPGRRRCAVGGSVDDGRVWLLRLGTGRSRRRRYDCEAGLPTRLPPGATRVSRRSTGFRLIPKTGHASRQVDQAGQGEGPGGECIGSRPRVPRFRAATGCISRPANAWTGKSAPVPTAHQLPPAAPRDHTDWARGPTEIRAWFVLSEAD